MSTSLQVPRIGVGVFVLNDKNQFIFGRRKGSHGAGTWALPGGHLEMHESFEDCARREVLEETGLMLKDVKFLTATNSTRIDGSKHYVTIFMVSTLSDSASQPQLLEPNKCEGWEWVSWETMLGWVDEQTKLDLEDGMGDRGQNPLFLPMIDLVQQHPGCRPSLVES
ncbi:hypothetical protein H2198_009011 [Neophaeococcomyces mojaviensis]|uniref:Uncharacterized protein n=1 Tax=Neophaeococcomyces mojaviensis TaxID=3383035 RepID=A0ACC2ZVN5_9EURO|nr:hypothetical protein H2198_009011 [Knufia sp. JES_112]